MLSFVYLFSHGNITSENVNPMICLRHSPLTLNLAFNKTFLVLYKTCNHLWTKHFDPIMLCPHIFSQTLCKISNFDSFDMITLWILMLTKYEIMVKRLLSMVYILYHKTFLQFVNLFENDLNVNKIWKAVPLFLVEYVSNNYFLFI